MLVQCYMSILQDIKDTGCYTVTQAHSQMTKILPVMRAHFKIAKILAVTLLHRCTSRYQVFTIPDNKDTGCNAVTLLHCYTSIL